MIKIIVISLLAIYTISAISLFFDDMDNPNATNKITQKRHH